jgi:hypothetical protein
MEKQIKLKNDPSISSGIERSTYTAGDISNFRKVIDTNKKLIEMTGSGAFSNNFEKDAVNMTAKFDSMKIAKLLSGGVGEIMLQKAEEIGQQESQISDKKSAKKKKSPVDSFLFNGGKKVGQIDTALYTTIADGQQKRMLKGDGVADILARLYNLVKGQKELDKRNSELERDFAEEKEKEAESFHKELLEALKNKKTATIIKKENTEDNGPSWFTMLMDALKDLSRFITNTIDNIWEAIKEVGGHLLSLAKKIAGVGLAASIGKKLLSSPKSKTKMVPEKIEEHKGKDNKKDKSTTKKEEEKKKNGKASKIEEKERKTRVDSKTAKGALRMAKILGGITAAAGVAAAIYNLVEQYQNGEIESESELKKQVISTVTPILTSAAGGIVLGELGATIGTFIFPGAGTLIGGTAGLIGGSVIGEKVGNQIATKAIDYLIDHPTTESKPQTAKPEKVPTKEVAQAEVEEEDDNESMLSKIEQDPHVQQMSNFVKSMGGKVEETAKPIYEKAKSKVSEMAREIPSLDEKLAKSVGENLKMKTEEIYSGIKQTVINNSKKINVATASGDSMVSEGSVEVRIDDPTKYTVDVKNARPV